MKATTTRERGAARREEDEHTMYEETAALAHAWGHWVRDARHISAMTTDGRVVNGELIAVGVHDDAPGGSQLGATIRTDAASGAVEVVFQSELQTMRGPGRQSSRASADAERKRADRKVAPQLVAVKPGESVAAVLAAALGDESLIAALTPAVPQPQPGTSEAAALLTLDRPLTSEDEALIQAVSGADETAPAVEEIAPGEVLDAFTAPAQSAQGTQGTIEYACDTPGCEQVVVLPADEAPAKGVPVFCSACEGAAVKRAEVTAAVRSKRTKATATTAATVTIGYPKSKQTGKPAGAKAKAGAK